MIISDDDLRSRADIEFELATQVWSNNYYLSSSLLTLLVLMYVFQDQEIAYKLSGSPRFADSAYASSSQFEALVSISPLNNVTSTSISTNVTPNNCDTLSPSADNGGTSQSNVTQSSSIDHPDSTLPPLPLQDGPFPVGVPSEQPADHAESLARILFIFGKLNPGIKYVQVQT